MDLLPWFATFAVSLLVGLEFGVLVGFMISVFFILYWSARPGIRVKRGQVMINQSFIYVYKLLIYKVNSLLSKKSVKFSLKTINNMNTNNIVCCPCRRQLELISY